MVKSAVETSYKRSESAVTFELHVSEKAGTQRHIEDTLPQCIPTGVTVQVFRWKEFDSTAEKYERLHNRYILTDLGGLRFGIGLDQSNSSSSDTSESDDVSVLTKGQHGKRSEQYCSESECFEPLGEPFEIIGTLAE